MKLKLHPIIRLNTQTTSISEMIDPYFVMFIKTTHIFFFDKMFCIDNGVFGKKKKTQKTKTSHGNNSHCLLSLCFKYFVFSIHAYVTKNWDNRHRQKNIKFYVQSLKKNKKRKKKTKQQTNQTTKTSKLIC